MAGAFALPLVEGRNGESILQSELGNGQFAIGELLKDLLPKLGPRGTLGTVHSGTPGFEGTKPSKHQPLQDML